MFAHFVICWRFFILRYFSFRITVWKVLLKTLLDGSLPSNLGFLFLSRCLIFKVQFFAALSRQLKEYITLFSLCQYFFETFFQKFSWLFSTLFTLSCGKLDYNTITQVNCQPFFRIFFATYPLIRAFLMFFRFTYTIYCVYTRFITLFPI